MLSTLFDMLQVYVIDEVERNFGYSRLSGILRFVHIGYRLLLAPPL
jgi:hypothetical protein